MPRKGENIYKRQDGRYEGRYIKEYGLDGKAKYRYIYGKHIPMLRSVLYDKKLSLKTQEKQCPQT